MPIVKQDHEWIDNHEEMYRIFKAVNNSQPSAFHDNTKCFGCFRCFTGFSLAIIEFWMGMKRNPSSGKWHSIYDPSDELADLSIKVSSENDNCIFNVGGQADPDRCNKDFPCAICSVSQDKVLYLKGLCKDDLKIYDIEYYIYGLKNNRPYFR